MGRFDRFGICRRRSWRGGLLDGGGRSRCQESGFEFVDAGFELVEVFEAWFEFVKGFDDAGKTLIVLLAVDTGFDPTIEGPHGQDKDPKLHGTSGRGLEAMLLIGRVYRVLGGERWIVRDGAAEWLRRVGRKTPATEGGRYKGSFFAASVERSKTMVGSPR
jgi:hypothetical protein